MLSLLPSSLSPFGPLRQPMYPNFEGLPFFPVQRHPSPVLSSSPPPSPRSIFREGFEQRNVRTTSLPNGSPRWGKIQSKKDAANIARTWAGGWGKLPYLFFATLESTCGRARAHTHSCSACPEKTYLDCLQVSVSPSPPRTHLPPAALLPTHPPTASPQLGDQQTHAHTLRASARPPRQRGLHSPRPPPLRRGPLGKKSSTQPTVEPTDRRPTCAPSPFSLPGSRGPWSAPVRSTLQPA